MTKRRGQTLRRAAREPLFQFTLLAVVIFATDALRSDSGREQIRVERVTIDYLVQQRADLLLRKLTPEEREEVIAGFVEEEILVREAYMRGLDKTSRIRSQLVRAMRFLLVEDLPAPSEEALRNFFETHRARYELPPTVTFEQVFFADPERVPDGVLARLRDGADFRALGESPPGGNPIVPRATQAGLVSFFGPDSARRILAIEDGDWHGPLASAQGVHFVRITAREPARLPRFEDMEPYLRTAWDVEGGRASLERRVEELKRDYRIVIEGEVGG